MKGSPEVQIIGKNTSIAKKKLFSKLLKRKTKAQYDRSAEILQNHLFSPYDKSLTTAEFDLSKFHLIQFIISLQSPSGL